MRIIAAIDLWQGKVVRLRQGNFAHQDIIHDDPIATGETLLSWGVQWWHIVDLEGAKKGSLQQQNVLKALRYRFPTVQMNVGGGIRSEKDLQWVLETGFDYVVMGSLAVEASQTVQSWIAQYGAHRFILAADMKGGSLAIKGWQASVPLQAEEFIVSWKAAQPYAFLCTEVERDGMLSGPDLPLYQHLQSLAAPVPVIASGGIRGASDLRALASVGITAAIVGKALYTDPAVKDWIHEFR